MPGRRAKTVEEHKQQGTYQPCRHGHHTNPEPTPGAPEPPDHLDGEALAMWHRMCGSFADMKTLAMVDAAALERFCFLWERADRVDRILSDPAVDLLFEKVTVDSSGVEHVEPKRNPLLAESLALNRELRMWLAEFGMTPAARGKVKIPKKAEEEDPRRKAAAAFLKPVRGGRASA